MSWVEVSRINSDFLNEPLNFHNYINDISTFGTKSYVLKTPNEGIWKALVSGSLMLFGHDEIHDIVLNRLTDEDIDCMIDGDETYHIAPNLRLGQCFNSFYNTNVFSDGDIKAVLRNLSAANFNILDVKLQQGICRYISKYTDGEGAGRWIGNLFSIYELLVKTTMATILSDSEIWNNQIMNYGPLRFLICNSAAGIDFIADSSSTIFRDFVQMATYSIPATFDLISALASREKLQTFYNDEAVCNHLAEHVESIRAIVTHPTAFIELMNNSTAMKILVESELAMGVIIDGLTKAIATSTTLTDMEDYLVKFEEMITEIDDSEPSIEEVVSTKETVGNCVDTLNNIVNNAGVILNNAEYITHSNEALTAMADSETAINFIKNNYDTTFETATWGMIDILLGMHYAQKKFNIRDVWSVGDKRLVAHGPIPQGDNVNESHDAESINAIIIGIEHDTLASDTTRKAAVTVQYENIMKVGGCMSKLFGVEHDATPASSWINSARRLWCNNSFFNNLATEVNSRIKPIVHSITLEDDSKEQCADSCFLISAIEAFGIDQSGAAIEEGKRYEYFKNNSANLTKSINGGIVWEWWTRTRYTYNPATNAYKYVIINMTEINTTHSEDSYNDKGICPAWCF